jgi:NADH:ubiquinone oxidoreductase subunit F (NADH-binding)/NADH:ubiquinone oxidoreductase subunit E
MTNKRIIFKPVSPQVEAIVQQHHGQPELVLEILVALQAKVGALTRDMLEDVARLLGLPASRIFGIASFYSMLEIADTHPSLGRAMVRVCDGPVCWLCRTESSSMRTGSAAFPAAQVKRTSCLGLCDRAPAVLVEHEQVGPLKAGMVAENIEYTHRNTEDYRVPRPGEVRVMLEHIDKIDPDSVGSAIAAGVYQGLASALSLAPEDVINEVEKSTLAGRGGAGFPVGRKWRYVSSAARSPKFVICNADESEPLTFKDRVLIDTNPHQILEGMAIAGYATGAKVGYIYIRGEYARQASLLKRAVEQAEQAGWLGENIQGSGFNFHVHVHCGAGAYICGEETALIESLEGKRGEPRLRPPYPPISGFHNLPTLVNNVESLCAIPHILRHGADWYKRLGHNSIGGTKLYMVLGQINRPGLFEAPFGLTLRRIMDEFGGGLRTGSKFHFALCGGAAGTIVDKRMLDIPIDYASARLGISLGSGAFLICDELVSPVDMLRELMHFFANESCGKCTPCRIGTVRSHELLVRLTEHNGLPGDLEELAKLAGLMQSASFCGLGQSVSIPVTSALANFRNEFESKIKSSLCQ